MRSSRQLERRCQEDLAFRVLAANQTTDHVTLARFRVRREQALAGFLVESLKLCAAAGMVQVGTVALDGTKLAANAAGKANRTHERLKAEVAEILRQAAAIDQREDRLFGDARGDELPEALSSKAERLARRRQAKAQLEAEAAAREQVYQRRVAAHAAAARAKGRTPRTLKRRPQETPNPDATANATDPDSRFLHTRAGTLQGYNAQAVVTEQQLVVAAELPQDANDLQPLAVAASHRGDAGRGRDRPATGGGAGGLRVLVDRQPDPDPGRAGAADPAGQARPTGQAPQDGMPSESKNDGLRAVMKAKLASDDGKTRYAMRKQTVEPVFGQVKEVRGARRLMRRGLTACDAEWKLLCGTHNLLKLRRHAAWAPCLAVMVAFRVASAVPPGLVARPTQRGQPGGVYCRATCCRVTAPAETCRLAGGGWWGAATAGTGG